MRINSGFLGNCSPTPPLSQHQHLILTLDKMMAQGRGRWAVSMKPKLIRICICLAFPCSIFSQVNVHGMYFQLGLEGAQSFSQPFFVSSLNAPDKKNSCIEDYVDPRRFILRGRLGRCSVELHRGPFYGRLWFFYWGPHETSTATVAARRTGSILACASRFSVNFFAVPAQLRREMTKCEVLFST